MYMAQEQAPAVNEEPPSKSLTGMLNAFSLLLSLIVQQLMSALLIAIGRSFTAIQASKEK